MHRLEPFPQYSAIRIFINREEDEIKQFYYCYCYFYFCLEFNWSRRLSFYVASCSAYKKKNNTQKESARYQRDNGINCLQLLCIENDTVGVEGLNALEKLQIY